MSYLLQKRLLYDYGKCYGVFIRAVWGVFVGGL